MSIPADKLLAIQRHFAPLIGVQIDHYETAEMYSESGRWCEVPDLPLRNFCDSGSVVSISWFQIDELWLSSDTSLPPFANEFAPIRWVENGIPSINRCLGRTILGVRLGRGQMSLDRREIEIWTRLVVNLGDCWLEVFNALDENGYCLHDSPPEGEFIDCV